MQTLSIHDQYGGMTGGLNLKRDATCHQDEIRNATGGEISLTLDIGHKPTQISIFAYVNNLLNSDLSKFRNSKPSLQPARAFTQ